MKIEPIISIITPVLNAENYIRECAESVFSQTWENWEWIIVDNGCTDCSMDIVGEFPQSKIIILNEAKKGVSNARNKALRNMKGEFFCFLDADDVLPKFSLESRAQLLIENQELSFVDGVVITKDAKLERATSKYQPNYRGEPLDELLQINESCFFGNTWMIRRDQETTYAFNAFMKHSEDLLFYISICRDKQYDFTSEEVLYCRRGHESAMEDLVGIETGYKQLAEALKKVDYVRNFQLQNYRRKAKSIMLKTWLKNGSIARFMKLLFSGI